MPAALTDPQILEVLDNEPEAVKDGSSAVIALTDVAQICGQAVAVEAEVPMEELPTTPEGAVPNRTWRVGPEDFTLCCVIGQGAFGRVLQVRSKFDGNIYAMKVIRKRLLKKKDHFTYMRAERDIMTKVDHPFIVSLNFSFQTEDKLFLVMNYLAGGELFFHLRKQGLILEDVARFYAAEMVLALEHLHSRGIIHRDLKPENVLLGGDGHLCLTDFGLAKELGVADGAEEGGKARTLCGTSEYIAPEMITRKGYGKAVDWWSLGALLYEMLTGNPPFRAKNIKDLYRKILNDKVSMPKYLTSEAHGLMKGLLERNVQKRLGAAKSTMFEVGGVSVLKAHRFFKGIDWQRLARKQVPAPVIPTVMSEQDTSNFDEEFTKMDLSSSYVEMEDTEATHSDTFQGFSFVDGAFELPVETPSYRKAKPLPTLYVVEEVTDAEDRQEHDGIASNPDLFDGVDDDRADKVNQTERGVHVLKPVADVEVNRQEQQPPQGPPSPPPELVTKAQAECDVPVSQSEQWPAVELKPAPKPMPPVIPIAPAIITDIGGDAPTIPRVGLRAGPMPVKQKSWSAVVAVHSEQQQTSTQGQQQKEQGVVDHRQEAEAPVQSTPIPAIAPEAPAPAPAPVEEVWEVVAKKVKKGKGKARK